MLWGKSSNANILEKMIGTQTEYEKTIKLSNLSTAEKDIIMLASIQLKKKNYKSEVIDKAYNVLFKG